MAAITQKHLYGWRMEQVLRPYLEDFLEEGEVTPTAFRFDGCDAKTIKSDNEIKARPKYSVKYKKLQDKDTYPDWVMPCCKADKFKTDTGRELNFFYYWAANQQLFWLPYNPEKFKNYRREVPFWSRQEHFFIPKEDWTLIYEELSDSE